MKQADLIEQNFEECRTQACSKNYNQVYEWTILSIDIDMFWRVYWQFDRGIDDMIGPQTRWKTIDEILQCY